METNLNRENRIAGPALAALGALTITGANGLPAVPGQPVGPAVFPYIIGAGLCLCGLLITFNIGVETEEPGEVIEATGPGRAMLLLRLVLPPLLLLAYFIAIESLGFLITGGLIVLVTSLCLGARPLLAIGLSVGSPVFIHSVFSGLLRVPLPEGLLSLPW